MKKFNTSDNKPVIGFIGNFHPPFSTENDRAFAFEKLGYTVVKYQENETQLDHLSRGLWENYYDVLFYSHTHGWEIPGLVEFFKECRRRGVPTVSVHLDRWAGLDREKDVGKEATWHTEFMFMADGSPEAVELYEKVGKKEEVDWWYLPPGVDERGCWIAKPEPGAGNDVIFVGSKGYHPEYPYRGQLIDWLRKTYGDLFTHYGNDGEGGVIRGDDLNRVYANSKVVVGDSCFGGKFRYYSDRVTETIGRGGFLIHPYIRSQGHDVWVSEITGYLHGDFSSLKTMIDYSLENENWRERERLFWFGYVKRNATYTHRAKEMMEVILDKMNETSS